MFTKLGDDEQCAHAQKLVCSMYGQTKLPSVPEARLEMFLKKYKPLMFPSYFAETKKEKLCLQYKCRECGWVVQDDCYRLKWYDDEVSPTTVEDICHDDSENDICCSGLKG